MSDATVIPFWIDHDSGDVWHAPDESSWVTSLVLRDGSLVLYPSIQGHVRLEAAGWPDELVADGWVKMASAMTDRRRIWAREHRDTLNGGEHGCCSGIA